MRLPVIILIAALAVGGVVISLGFLTDPKTVTEEGGAPEELSAFEKLEQYRDDLVRINEYNIQVLDETRAADPGTNATTSNQTDQEIAILEQVIAQNIEEIQEISERLAEMVP